MCCCSKNKVIDALLSINHNLDVDNNSDIQKCIDCIMNGKREKMENAYNKMSNDKNDYLKECEICKIKFEIAPNRVYYHFDMQLSYIHNVLQGNSSDFKRIKGLCSNCAKTLYEKILISTKNLIKELENDIQKK